MNYWEWDWDDALGGLLYVSLIALVIFVLFAAMADHRPNGYYIRTQRDKFSQVTCIYNSSPWSFDEVAACFDTPLEAIRVMIALQRAEDAMIAIPVGVR